MIVSQCLHLLRFDAQGARFNVMVDIEIAHVKAGTLSLGKPRGDRNSGGDRLSGSDH